METLEWIFIYFIVPIIGGFIGAIIVGILNNKNEKLSMELKDYTTEELRAEIKRRYSLVQAEKAKIKRCRQCSHWGEITYFGTPNKDTSFGGSKCCRFFTTKSGKHYRCHVASQLACEHFEEKIG